MGRARCECTLPVYRDGTRLELDAALDAARSTAQEQRESAVSALARVTDLSESLASATQERDKIRSEAALALRGAQREADRTVRRVQQVTHLDFGVADEVADEIADEIVDEMLLNTRSCLLLTR